MVDVEGAEEDVVGRSQSSRRIERVEGRGREEREQPENNEKLHVENLTIFH